MLLTLLIGEFVIFYCNDMWRLMFVPLSWIDFLYRNLSILITQFILHAFLIFKSRSMHDNADLEGNKNVYRLNDLTY